MGVIVNSRFFFPPSSLLGTLSASAAQCGQCVFLSFAPRNAVLEADFAKKGYKLPAARKTGTTIAGVVYRVSRDRRRAAGVHEPAPWTPLGSAGKGTCHRAHQEPALPEGLC